MSALIKHWKSRALRFAQLKGDRLNSLRRHAEMLVDQGVVLGLWKVRGSPAVEEFDGEARFALVTVNFSTTRYLKLMLLTLCEQQQLRRLSRIILVDNDSREGGKHFGRTLAARCAGVHLAENRYWVNHARGLRRGVSELGKVERDLPPGACSNVLLVCDTDIIFRSPDTLEALAVRFEQTDTVFAGELREGIYKYPEAQASFFALRRDAYARGDVMPFVHHGAPAYFTQRSLWRAQLPFENFPSNQGGYILHRGRSGVAAARSYRKRDAYATAPAHHPHFMGVPGGQAIWAAAEARHARLLLPENEEALIEHLSERLASADVGS